MARDQPMTEVDVEEAREQIQELREEVRADLATDLGGDSEDYSSESYFRDLDESVTDGEAVPDGGE